MNVTFISSEAVPFAKTGGLADVCGTLPLALERFGIKVNIIMPRYKCVSYERHGLKRLNSHVATARIGDDISVYFIENEDYYDRDGIYGSQQGDYDDNLNRFQYFCWKALEILKQLNIKTDIVHCHDWQTGLIPAYLDQVFAADPYYKNIKSILTIHNLAYQGVFPKERFSKLKLDEKLFNKEGFEFYDQVNFLKGGILFSDLITTVSQKYAQEIQTDRYGCGLDGVLKERSEALRGILNGIDYDTWNPVTDRFIVQNYSPENLTGKLENKRFIQKTCGFSARRDIPLFSYVGRLSYQKGVDLIADAMDELTKLNLQIVFLGHGEEKYHRLLEDLAQEYPEKIKCFLKFDEQLAHQLYAGSDFFLMPSRYEPCGLSQLISMRYGTAPIVFNTGGLADTVTPFNGMTLQGKGFVFLEYKAAVFAEAVRSAGKVFRHKEQMTALMSNAFNIHCSWDDAAQKYLRLYEECLQLA